MATLEIRKKSSKTWLHIPSDELEFILGKFTFSIDGNYFQIVEIGQAKRNLYLFSDITVIDETTSTTYPAQASISALSLLLETLGYPAFYRDGQTNLNLDDLNNVTISTPSNGQVLTYQDGVWINQNSSGGGVQSVSGDTVDNTDPANPIVNVPTLQQVTDEGRTFDETVSSTDYSFNVFSGATSLKEFFAKITNGGNLSQLFFRRNLLNFKVWSSSTNSQEILSSAVGMDLIYTNSNGKTTLRANGKAVAGDVVYQPNIRTEAGTYNIASETIRLGGSGTATVTAQGKKNYVVNPSGASDIITIIDPTVSGASNTDYTVLVMTGSAIIGGITYTKGAFIIRYYDAFLATWFSSVHYPPSQTITNGVTDKAPSEDAVFDALALKQDALTETNFGSFSNGLTSKNTLVDADTVNSVDSGDSNKAKKTTWLNVWTNYIKTKADAVYLGLTAGANYRLTVSDGSGNRGNAAAITASRALKSDANGIPTHFDTATEPTLTELSYVKGVNSAIQTQLNARKKIIYATAPNVTHTGTTAETEVLKIEVPAGYLTTSDLLNLNRIIVTRGTSQSGNLDIKVKISTDGNLPSGTTGQIAFIQAAGFQRCNGLSRGFWQESGNLNGLNSSINATTDIGMWNTNLFFISFNPASKFYIHISFTLANSADNGILKLVDITN